jgi:hypothetical protein
MAIQLKNLLLDAEDGSFTINLPDGTTSTQQFRQRSFTYGDNANTDPPLIVKDFDGNPLPGVEDSTTNPTLELVGEVTDNFVRGGAVTLAQRAVTDLERLGKVLISPNGLAWSVAQLALARTNPVGPIHPKVKGDGLGSKIAALAEKATGGPRNRKTLPLSVLATAGTGAAGIRFRKDGLIDTKFESGYNYDSARGGPKYENRLLEIVKDGEDINSDLVLRGVYEKLYIKTSETSAVFEDLGIPTEAISAASNIIPIREYNGGAHSTFGIGKTTIKRFRSNPYIISDKTLGQIDNNGYLPLFNTKLFELRQGDIPSQLHKDYRNVGGTVDNKPIGKPIPDNRTRIGLYKLGSPGIEQQGEERNVYNIDTIDQISAQAIFNREDLQDPNLTDYIKFRIAVVDNDNPLNDKIILFRAFLDSLSDNYTGTWNSYKYNGRAEEFYTYGGFQRGIDFGFKIHSQTRHEQKPLWEKLNYLVAQTAPEYRNRRMRGVFSRLTIGDWMHEIPGFFTSVNLSWQTSYPWEIQHDPEGLDSDVSQYPHILDVSCNFQPIHNFAPTNSPTTPFIIPDVTFKPQKPEPVVADNEELGKALPPITNTNPEPSISTPATTETAPEVNLNTLDTSAFNLTF